MGRDFLSKLILFSLTLVNTGCKEDGKKETSSTSSDPIEAEFENCQAIGGGQTVKKIADAVALINKLPRPATIPCFLAALPRPIRVAAAASFISAQPAEGDDSPRYFVVSDNLIITVTPKGIGRDLVEFSEFDGNTASVKGELKLPLTRKLELSDPYDRIYDDDQGRSTCGICHGSESVVGGGYPEKATISNALRPRPNLILSRTSIENLNKQCAGSDEDQCVMIRAIFHTEIPEEYVFPETMPIL